MSAPQAVLTGLVGAVAGGDVGVDRGMAKRAPETVQAQACGDVAEI